MDTRKRGLEMTKPIRRKYQWDSKVLSAKVAEAAKLLAMLTPSLIDDLIRRGIETSEPDGYGSGGNEGGRSSDIFASSTASSALRGLSSPDPDENGNKEKSDNWDERSRENDVIAQALDKIFGKLDGIGSDARIIDKQLSVVIHAGDKAKTASQLSICHGCHRDVACTAADPIRVGYCSGCDTAWRRWKATFGQGDMGLARSLFEAQREKFEGHHESACEMCAYLAELIRHAEPVA